MKDNEFYNMRGNVHTATYYLQGNYKPNSSTGKAISKYRPSSRKGQAGTLIQFNPNELCQGFCMSLSSYMNALRYCSIAMGLSSDPTLSRLDFKVDYTTRQERDYLQWVKVCEWVLCCFGIKKKARKKNEGRTDSFLSIGHEKTFAGTKGWCMVCYNKETQKAAEGVGYRFEIQRMEIKEKAESDILQDMRAMMLSLPRHALEAEHLQNQRLIALWEQTAPDKLEKRSVNEFIRAHVRDIYTIQQLKGLYELLGYNKAAANKAAYNFCSRHASALVLLKQQDIEQFCDVVASLITAYLEKPLAA